MEIAFTVGCVACEGHLWNLFTKQVPDLVVGHVAHLVVVLEDIAHLIANATIFRFHQSIAGFVLCAHIAVDAFPAFVTFAAVAITNRSVFVAAGQRATY